MTPQQVADRIEEAFRTLKCLPDRDRHKSIKSFWPDVMNERQDLWYNYNRHETVMPRYTPSPSEVSRMEEVLYIWFPMIRVRDLAKTKRYYKICTMRALNIPWRAIAYEIGKGEKTCWRYHVACLQSICMKVKK